MPKPPGTAFCGTSWGSLGEPPSPPAGGRPVAAMICAQRIADKSPAPLNSTPNGTG
jgi:hypothetical protein